MNSVALAESQWSWISYLNFRNSIQKNDVVWIKPFTLSKFYLLVIAMEAKLRGS